MSNAILNAVFGDDHNKGSSSKGITRLVLLAIADRADENGVAWCGTEDIAKRAGILRQHVSRHTKKLAATGEVEIRKRDGDKNQNIYHVRLCPISGQSQGGTVPKRDGGCPKVVRDMSQGGTQTPLTPKNPKSSSSAETTASGFDEFWSAYPRKVGKATAEKAWAKAKLPPEQDLLTAIENQKANWSDPKFIPHPATWLNGRRWEDEGTTDTSRPTLATREVRKDIVRPKQAPRIIE